MPEEQITIGINEIAELIRNKYGYKSVSIDRIWTGIRCDDMQYVELGPGSILDVHISVNGKETKDTIIVITKADIGLSIEIVNPQLASIKSDNISDADYALGILQEWDNETAFVLRENMTLVISEETKTLKVEPIEGVGGTIKPFENERETMNKLIVRIKLAIKDILQYQKALSSISKAAPEATKRLHEQSTKQINAAMGAINEADWPVEDGMELLCAINHQGFTYPESINILKEVMFVTDPGKELFSMGKPRRDWRIVLEEIIEKRQKYIQEYERQKIFENALHYGLEITKDIRKKETEKELEDVNWAIQTLEKISFKYQSEFPREMVSELSEAKNRKCALLEKLASVTKKEEKPLCTNICPDPNLIRVVDSHGADMEEETKAAIARNWARIANCHWKKEYKCKWDN